MHKIIRNILWTLAALLMASGTQAATTYQYAGNDFSTIVDNAPPAGSYTTVMSVSGGFTVNTAFSTMPLGDISGSVLSYSFFDGRNTLTDANSSITTFEVAINGLGEIDEWNIFLGIGTAGSVGAQGNALLTQNYPAIVRDRGFLQECLSVLNESCISTSNDYGEILNSPGTWSVVPAPAAAWLFCSALGLLSWARRRTA